jgi:hypothetical protein
MALAKQDNLTKTNPFDSRHLLHSEQKPLFIKGFFNLCLFSWHIFGTVFLKREFFDDLYLSIWEHMRVDI